jgi:hypothetical protein
MLRLANDFVRFVLAGFLFVFTVCVKTTYASASAND